MHVPLEARWCLVVHDRWVRTSFSPAPIARIEEESTTTREKSILSTARNLASSIA
ncbi:hypothetical protein HDG35_007520 [Paraburkholderia sp. JPY681]|nr:hypothetical protein [Paraburkholderia atlantica]